MKTLARGPSQLPLLLLSVTSLSGQENQQQIQPTPDAPTLQVTHRLICTVCWLHPTIRFSRLRKGNDFSVG